MRYDCLIIDDEKELADNTCEYFNMFGVNTHAVYSHDEAIEFLGNNEAGLILLDINLGDGSGFELCKIIRRDTDIPIFFISARQSDDDVLIALNIGGDDYIKKPYSLSVLLAKVKVILKRTSHKDSSEDPSSPTPSSDNSPIDKDTMSFILNGRKIPLKAREFALCQYLYEHRNSIVTKDQIFDAVWGDSFYSDGTLNVHIRRLREKIEDDPNDPKIIKTIWGTGYLMEI
ncbi:MAG: response regulator transcription factor [Clostridiales bacterium]|nr:response regulator transcription factor [Clostridiales bacterium]